MMLLQILQHPYIDRDAKVGCNLNHDVTFEVMLIIQTHKMASFVLLGLIMFVNGRCTTKYAKNNAFCAIFGYDYECSKACHFSLDE